MQAHRPTMTVAPQLVIPRVTDRHAVVVGTDQCLPPPIVTPAYPNTRRRIREARPLATTLRHVTTRRHVTIAPTIAPIADRSSHQPHSSSSNSRVSQSTTLR